MGSAQTPHLAVGGKVNRKRTVPVIADDGVSDQNRPHLLGVERRFTARDGPAAAGGDGQSGKQRCSKGYAAGRSSHENGLREQRQGPSVPCPNG